MYADGCWRSRDCGGPFDFADEADFRRGIDLFVEMVRKRYNRARPCTPLIARQQFAWRSMLYQLKANIDIAEEEVRVTGWDRSVYAPQKLIGSSYPERAAEWVRLGPGSAGTTAARIWRIC